MRACNRIDQLPRDADFPRRLPHRPLEDRGDAEAAPDFLDIDRSALEGEARIASDHEQPFEPRKRGDDLLNHSVRKILLLGIARHVLERQNGDRRSVGERQSLRALDRRLYRRCRRTARIHPQPPRSHRFNNILQVLRTHIVKDDIDLPADLTLCVVRDANATRLRNPFKASGDVDAVAKDIVVIDDDVADVDADAKFDPLDLRHRSILLSHTALDLNGAAHRIYDTAELSEHAIARVLNDRATMFADLGISEPTQTLPQPDVCPFLVQAGQATISSHISRKDSCKPPFNAIVSQNGLPRSVDPSDISRHCDKRSRETPLPRTITFLAAVAVTLWCVVCALMADAWATPLERVEFEGADQQLISGGLIRGDHIQGYMAKPEGAGPFPAVIGLHGCGGMPDTTKRKLADELVGWGYVVLLVDSFPTPRVAHPSPCAYSDIPAIPTSHPYI